MSTSRPDAVVVGAGVIGTAVALELARTGRQVVVVDKAGAAGHGSTSASSAIIRFNYSTFDGVATAWEAQHLWTSWPDHLRLTGRRPLAAFHRTGAVLLDSPAVTPSGVTALFDRAGVQYERWDAPTLRRRLPGSTPGGTGRRSRWTTTPSSTHRPASSAPSSPRTPGSSTTRSSPPRTSPTRRVSWARASCSTTPWWPSTGTRTGWRASGWPTERESPPRWWSTPPARGRGPQPAVWRRRRFHDRRAPAARGGPPDRRTERPHRRSRSRPRRRRPRPRHLSASGLQRPPPGRRHRATLRPAGVDRRPGRSRPPPHRPPLPDPGHPGSPPLPGDRHPEPARRRRGRVRRRRRLDPDLRPHRPRRLLRRHGHERQPVQERPAGGPLPRHPGRPGRGRPRPRRRPGPLPLRAHRQRRGPGRLLRRRPARPGSARTVMG